MDRVLGLENDLLGLQSLRAWLRVHHIFMKGWLQSFLQFTDRLGEILLCFASAHDILGGARVA